MSYLRNLNKHVLKIDYIFALQMIHICLANESKLHIPESSVYKIPKHSRYLLDDPRIFCFLSAKYGHASNLRSMPTISHNPVELARRSSSTGVHESCICNASTKVESLFVFYILVE